MAVAAAGSKKGKGSKAPGQGAKRRKRPPGLPQEESIVSTTTFTSPATGRRYRIIRTTEADPYDKPARRRKKDH